VGKVQRAGARYRPYSLVGPGQALFLFPLGESPRVRRAEGRGVMTRAASPHRRRGRLSARHAALFGFGPRFRRACEAHHRQPAPGGGS